MNNVPLRDAKETYRDADAVDNASPTVRGVNVDPPAMRATTRGFERSITNSSRAAWSCPGTHEYNCSIEVLSADVSPVAEHPARLVPSPPSSNVTLRHSSPMSAGMS